MKQKLQISRYCAIRENRVDTQDGLQYRVQDQPISQFMKNVYQRSAIAYPKYHKMDRLSKLGFLAAEVLLKDRLPGEDYAPEEVAIVLANAASSIDTDRKFQDSISSRTEYFPSPSVFVYTLPNIVAGEICIRHGFQGENIFFVSEQFEPDVLYVDVRYIFDAGMASCCITGWVEVDRNHYEAVLFLVEKSSSSRPGIVNFDVEQLNKIYEGAGRQS